MFTQVSDGRSDQGREHPVAAVLALAAAATVAGMAGYAAITGWVADAPIEIRHDRRGFGSAARILSPSKATIWRVITGADAEAFDAAVGTWLTRGLQAVTEAANDGASTGNADGPVALMQVRAGRQDCPRRHRRRGQPAAPAGRLGRPASRLGRPTWADHGGRGPD